MSTLGTKLKKTAKKMSKPKGPVWDGPMKGGITQSLLAKFLVCRERFRLLVIEGLKPVDRFNHRTSYGDMWHLCEEAIVEGTDWTGKLREHCTDLCRKYRGQQSDINHWYNVCLHQFPVYLDYWKKHPDVKTRKNLFKEEVFNVPYKLPSGRVVRLRGKWDSGDEIGKKPKVYLQENKTKGDVSEKQLNRQLQFDLQTMLYLVALKIAYPKFNIGGVRYNVVRRPLSGGKGSIRPHKARGKKPAETMDHFYLRLQQYFKDEPGNFFMRWRAEVPQADIRRFEIRFLVPILEQLCDWWEFMEKCKGVPWGMPEWRFKENYIHWQTPYGFYSPLLDGGSTDLDEYITNGSLVGLERVDRLFNELDT